MFKHVGKKIQAVALVAFSVQAVVSCILGFLLGKMLYDASGEMLVAFLAGIVVMALSIFVGWLSVLLLFAFGKIEEHCEEQSNLLRILVAKTSASEEKEKKCSNCGMTLTEDSLFCSSCGTPYKQ